jgi:hypothetical protein
METAQDIFYASVMNFIMEWRDAVGKDSNLVQAGVRLAQIMSATFAYFYIAARLYPIIAAEERLSIVPLLRPFALGLAIMLWGDVVDMVKIPGNFFEKSAQKEFTTTWNALRVKSEERFTKYDELYKAVITVGTHVDRSESAERSFNMQSSDISKSAGWDPLGIGNKIAAMYALVINKTKRLLVGLFEFLSLLFMNVVVCGVLFMQAIAYLILIILGPLAFAFSILDPWKRSWAQWVARFFSVTMWSGLAYMICWAGANIMLTLIQYDIDFMQALINKGHWEASMLQAYNGLDTMLFPLLCLFTAFGMIIIFPLSTWIIQTSGAATVVTAPLSAATQTAGAVTGVVIGSKVAGK